MTEDLLLQINLLDYEQILELGVLCHKRKNDLFEGHYSKIQEKYKQEREKRDLRKQDFEENILPKIKEYLIQNLIPNKSIIKVKGARDGKGIRLFLRFFESKDYLECRQIIRKKELIDINTWVYKNIQRLGQITEHMIDKVTHIEINEKLVPIKELI